MVRLPRISTRLTTLWAANEYDFILGSLHCLKGQPDFWQVDYEKNDPFEFFDMYLDQLYELVKWNGFDSLAHLTYPLRYINGEHHFGLELSNYAEKVDEILKLLAKNEKALEINTSGYRQAYGKPLPDFDVVKKFKELGGRYITFARTPTTPPMSAKTSPTEWKWQSRRIFLFHYL